MTETLATTEEEQVLPRSAAPFRAFVWYWCFSSKAFNLERISAIERRCLHNNSMVLGNLALFQKIRSLKISATTEARRNWILSINGLETARASSKVFKLTYCVSRFFFNEWHDPLCFPISLRHRTSKSVCRVASFPISSERSCSLNFP